jgi:hypothetical protein
MINGHCLGDSNRHKFAKVTAGTMRRSAPFVMVHVNTYVHFETAASLQLGARAEERLKPTVRAGKQASAPFADVGSLDGVLLSDAEAGVRQLLIPQATGCFTVDCLHPHTEPRHNRAWDHIRVLCARRGLLT